MHKRPMIRVLVASLATILFGIVFAMPAVADHDGDDDGRGEGSERNLTIEAECNSVEVESSKQISEVTVFFADGTSEEFHPSDGDSDDDGDDDDDDADDDADEDPDDADDSDEDSDDNHEFFETFDETVASATARSGGDEVEDSAEDCETAEETSDEEDDSADDAGDDESEDSGDDVDDSGGDGDGGDDGERQVISSTSRTGGSSGGDSLSDGDGSAVAATSGTAATGGGGGAATGSTAGAAAPSDAAGSDFDFFGGSAEVLAQLAFANGAKICPSGPYKGMPYVNIKDCGEAVLAAHLAATGPPGIGSLAAFGGVLMGTGLGLLGLYRRNRHRA